MRKNFLIILILLSAAGCNSPTKEKEFSILNDNSYPRWLQSGLIHSDQTSGITYIGNSSTSKKLFLIADDIGKIFHLTIEEDTILNLTPVNFSPSVAAYLDTFPKADFEEIVYDKYTGNVYLSIEGNNPDPKKFAGIYKLTFENNDLKSNEITSIEKLNINPQNLFTKYIQANIGYEGLAADENYFYLGLEGFSEQSVFADSTIIFVVDKSNLKIIKEINTKKFGIGTICGLYSDKNNSLYGVDRNNKKLFHLEFDASFNVTSSSIVNIKTHIPGYSQYEYVASLESITFDDQKNIYITDDPWKTFFIPSEDVLQKLDEKTVNNFKDFIPIIYKYNFND
ncbi:MAG: hypothetical protein ABI550_01630 [Ignavibacteriaceae bacterium]